MEKLSPWDKVKLARKIDRPISIDYISKVFDWLFAPLELSVDIPIKIPVILENGIKWSWDLGITPISLLGVGLVGLVIYWVVLK